MDTLRKALEPFVEAFKKASDPGTFDLYDEQPFHLTVPLGACREARAALSRSRARRRLAADRERAEGSLAPPPARSHPMSAGLFSTGSSAVISEDGRCRYRLDREVAESGQTFAYFGVNGSTAGPVENDHTVTKWIGFTIRFGGRRLIVGNPFAHRATDVRELRSVADPVGPENSFYLDQIIAEADILVPCWGDRGKLPKELRHHLDALARRLWASGKPVKVFGFTKGGDPLHPLMLGYDTSLVDWPAPGATP